jgi:beta-galactosidase/beta-glucuronidase
MTLPRQPYPRPHRVRPRWLNLNGWWEFAFDDDDRGLRDGWPFGKRFPLRIQVPFTFEAPLSGIGERAAHPVVWYRRDVNIPQAFCAARLLLHIGACDYAACVWVNGHAVGAHRGGYTPVTCEIHDAVRPGHNEIVIRVEDRPLWSQPRGKQIVGDAPAWIDYDRVTGIWQTVWLEPVPDTYITDVWSDFSLADGRLQVEVETNHPFAGEAEVVLGRDDAECGRQRAYMQERRQRRLSLHVRAPRLWTPDDPVLYDLTVTLRDGSAVTDLVSSYAGLRQFTARGRSLLLNGSPFYLRGVLDQGYFPDGWYTAASDDDLRRDIELIKTMGFNAARKHQKVEDPRWLYWADRLGLVVWGEMANGRDACDAHVAALTREWLEVVRRDRMHPCIMTWVPINESWGVDAVSRDAGQQASVQALYHLTKSLDPSRLTVANDGWEFFVGDLWGVHCYVTEAAALADHLERLLAAPTTEVAPGRPAALPGAAVQHVPVILSECGGLTLRAPDRPPPPDAWGYATMPDAGAFARRLRNLMDAIQGEGALSGFVWTQLTDVQQEANGLLYFDRTPKLPLAALRDIFAAVAARRIES